MARWDMSMLPILIIASSYLLCVNGIAVMSVDLGNEWMKIAVVSPGKPMEIILNKESNRKTPVAVSFRNGERFVGDLAMNTALRFPENTYHHFLDLIGKPFSHPEVKRFQKRFPHHKMSALPGTDTVIFHHKEGMDFTPEELISMILQKAQEVATDFTEQKITDCVITVPPYFNQAERRAIIKSADLANLKVLQLINSNTAAALNYGVFRRKHFNSTVQHIVLYDMGAADTVATVLAYQVVKTKDAVYLEENPQVTVKAVSWDRNLGGLEMQIRLRDHLAKLFNEQKKTTTDAFTSPSAMSKLFKEAGKLKHVLSANEHYMAQVEGLLDDQDFKAKVTRSDFLELIPDMIEKITRPIEKALEDAGMTVANIDQLILVGGGTRVPKVQEALVAYINTDLGKSLNTDEAPAMGAAYQAAYLSTGFKVKKFIIKDCNIFPIEVDFSRNVEKDGEMEVRQVKRMLFSHQNQYPQKKVMTFNKHTDDFHFYVGYNEETFKILGDRDQLEKKNISKIKVAGVADAFAKFKEEELESRAIKAHFRMDESGLLKLDQIEVEVKLKGSVEEELSTLSKLGNTISNLFGSGSGSDEKEEGKTEAMKDDEKATESEKAAAKEESFKNGTENKETDKNGTDSTVKKEVKPVIKKEELKVSRKVLDMPKFPKDLDLAIRKRLDKLDMDDKKKNRREAARNNVESFVFDCKSKLYQEQYEACTTEKEREKMGTALSEASDWLDEEDEEQEAEVYESKLKELKDVTKDMFMRAREHAERPEALKALTDTLNISSMFLNSLKNISAEDSVFTDVEIETLEKLINETNKWVGEMKTEQAATPLTEVPKMTVYMIAEKINNLDREIKYLLSKSKLAPKKPKEEQKATNESESTSETSQNSNKTSDEETDASTESPKEETLELPESVEPKKEEQPSEESDESVKATSSESSDKPHSEL